VFYLFSAAFSEEEEREVSAFVALQADREEVEANRFDVVGGNHYN
jgi:hypothetical protein